MADSTSPLDPVVAAANAATRVNESFDAASPASLYGRRASTTTALTWGYYGGRFASLSIANGTVALTASATNYIVANRTTGAISVATAITNWNDTAGFVRLYLVTTGASTVTSYEDHRQAVGASGGASFTNPMTTAEDLIKGGAAGAPVRLGVGLAGQVLTVVAGIVSWAASYVLPPATGTVLGGIKVGTGLSVTGDGTLSAPGGVAATNTQGLSDFANAAGTTTGLTYGFQAGVIRVDNVTTAVAAGTVALAASATNHVEITGAGVVSTNTVGFTAGRYPMATVTTDATVILSIADKRGIIDVPVSAVVQDKCRLFRNAAFTTATGTNKVPLDTVSFDTNTLAVLANNRIVPKKAGYYLVTGRASVSATAAGQRTFAALYKNGIEFARTVDTTVSAASFPGAGAADIAFFNGTTDFVELFLHTSAALALENFTQTTYLTIAGPLP